MKIAESNDNSEKLLSKLLFNQVAFQLPQQVQEEATIAQILTYRSPIYKQLLYYSFCILTCGIGYLFARWNLSLKLALLYSQCIDIEKATHLVITSLENEKELIKIGLKKMQINKSEKQSKSFEYRLYTYFYEDECFKAIETPFQTLTHEEIINNYSKGVESPEEIASQYGYNNTTIPDKSTGKILIDEILTPFYLFQIFSVCLWSIEEYYEYAIVIFLTSIISILVQLRETKQNFAKLRQMTSQDSVENVFRGQNDIVIENKQIIVNKTINNNKQKLSSKAIVPGDLIEVRDDWTVPCDCILLNGSCIINESMLTGESIPIIKNPIQFNKFIYQPNEDSKSITLFAGTKCLEARHPEKGQIPVLALAVQTGFSTIKGQLVRSILYPKPTTFSFYKDSLSFIAVLAMMSLVGFSLTIKDQIDELKEDNTTIFQMIINSLDLITITVPPALPTCLSIGVSFALARLSKKSIYCISPNKVNVAGKITIMCFDKTGTLTEDGLDLYGVRSIGYNHKKSKICFQDLIIDVNELPTPNVQFSMNLTGQNVYGQTKLQPTQLILEIMASCHGLAKVNGQLIGDPLEVKMFEATNFELDDLHNEVFKDNDRIQILKRFDFSSTLQRMSVIVQRNDKLRVHVKGSPEKLRELCHPTTVPRSFHKILEHYSKMGFRVLACGSKVIDSECNRDKAECNLTFLGFLIMQNKLKPVTRSIIQTLQDAMIRTIMVTGDNVLTAISVARQCNLVQPNQRIFLGDIAEEKLDGKNHITWKDFDMNDKVLNPENLSPELDIKDDSGDEFETPELFGQQEQQYEQQMEIVIEENEKVANSQHYENSKSMNLKKSKYQSYKEQEEQLKAENLDHLIDDQDPWKTDQPFVVAISGKAFQLLLNQIDTNPKARRLFGLMLEKAQIFARMKPEQKAQLITHLQKISKKALCGMCGDGANDCGALKAADVGISLSDAEASIAAPFTSKIQNISCVVKLLREGRASLVTSFQCFKYMALYSMIQFGTVTLLYFTLSNMSSLEYFYIDLFIIIPLAGTMGQTKAYKKLTQFQPGSNLISFPVLLSVIGQTLIQIGFQTFVYFYMKNQSWYRSGVDIHKDIGDVDDHLEMEICYENTILFLYANFQYVFQCVAFSIGKPFRREFYTNIYFTLWIILAMLFNSYIFLIEKSGFQDIFMLMFEYESTKNADLNTEIDRQWMYWLYGIMIINLITTIIFEKYIVPFTTRFYRGKKRKLLKRYKYSQNPYLNDQLQQK
ncbi:unnamed protein product [Paramecium primaurelia]|uniref:Cation-transporting ATPase n=1 Tax=Paramecium primaurelia TaxID=5886 RepID=A0A8S1ME82_PARPR|nr:unnamed protein product [Paramecium primaurelia]